ncbi:rod shape-determining protein RodA [Thiohalocapsa marina]|uniref:Peptidoglycan glycosyltransferase MrdB n=1 Tax=Thiohalocapsa marina TaxID=424902 RepID=A0A5M8FUB0_9GAMM|nr:rod shape-determining protein RodA [Thiohalocapsa marina]KAA6187386.1 rod shape-determining protein RodA [Thiohalocapsa marina]
MPGPDVASVSAAPAGGLFARLHLDPPLMAALLLLSGIGLAVLYSAGDAGSGQLERQLLRLGLAFGTLLIMAQLPPALLRRLAMPLFAAGTLLLLAVLLAGDTGKGAQRWLDLGILRFQPSELMKLTVPMAMAWLLSRRPLPPNAPALLLAALMLALPVLLIAVQPDLGTALLVAAAGLAVLFLAGMRWRLIALLAALAAAAAPVLWMLMRPYQRQRVLTFLDPGSDPLGAGYHIIQSQIAIGSGGTYGKGWLNGTQSQLEFLPEHSTDFIFAVIGEEFGFAGTLLLLGLYLFIILRALAISANAGDSFGRLLAGALTLVFFVYLFVNTGMVAGLLPVVGIPLPLISYGGTSMVTIMAGFGIIMSLATHPAFDARPSSAIR